MADIKLPSVKELYVPVFVAIKQLGGSGTNESIEREVVASINLSDEQLAVMYDSRPQSVVIDRIGWARSHLKIAGYLESPRRKVWALTERGRVSDTIDPREVGRAVRSNRQSSPPNRLEPSLIHSKAARGLQIVPLDQLVKHAGQWQDELYETLHQLSPPRIERFFKLLFTSEGIDQVEIVDSRSDGAIEGSMASAGFLTFRVTFRFIRGNKLVSAHEVDEFRRSVRASRADKGLLITLGSFTREATRDVVRGNVPTIELIDGDQFAAKLKESSLGVETERVLVERVIVNRRFFESL